jgi:F0F1-type ATP synthase membrane subunit b/b'
MQPADQQMIPQALQLIKDKPLRNFRIEVAADSLVQIDEAQTKRDRMEFIQAFGGFMREALPVAQSSPEMTPMLVEIMKFGISAFKQSKPIEGALDAALDQLKKAQANPQPKPNPEAEKIKAQQASEQARMQADGQIAQMRMQADTQTTQIKIQAEAQLEQMKAQNAAQIEAQKQQHEQQLKEMEIRSREEMDKWKAELDAATKVMVARIGANPGVDVPLLEAQQAASERFSAELNNHMSNHSNMMATMHDNSINMHQNAMDKLERAVQLVAAPKRVIRGPDGKVMGVEVAA